MVSRAQAEQRRGFDPDAPVRDRARGRSLFFDDLFYAKVREFNPRYNEAQGALLGRFRLLHTDIFDKLEKATPGECKLTGPSRRKPMSWYRNTSARIFCRKPVASTW